MTTRRSGSIHRRAATIAAALAALAAGLISCTEQPPPSPSPDAWKDDWSLERGFSLDVDTIGYELPTALAFVPSPGPDPKDPLYFVTELQGAVKVVTNDRSVFTFARDFFTLDPVTVDGATQSLEVGMAGICLDQPRGYVFVTFVYHDAQKVLRNNIVRFSTTPGRFAIEPASHVDFGRIFARDRSQISHQIGGCQVSGDSLYVGVGDGQQPFESQSLGSALGKILRMTVDGEPLPDNPFYEAHTDRPANYVWAYGLRNPFGVKLVDGAVFAADNGNAIDRFLRLEQGANYLWDGTDRSIGAVADAILAPGRGVTQLSYHQEAAHIFPSAFAGTFFLVVSGDSQNLATDAPPAILALDYDMQRRRLRRPPRSFLVYRGDRLQTMTAAEFGPDGLYFAALFPNASGATAVYRIAANPDRPHPHVVSTGLNPRRLISESGCFGCHALDESRTGRAGPVLDREQLVPRLSARIGSRDYQTTVARLDELSEEPFVSFREERGQVVAAQGTEKLRLWIEYHLLEPRFDNPAAQMPDLQLSEDEARTIADYLLGETGANAPEAAAGGNWTARLRPLFLQPRAVVLMVGLAAGAIGGALGYRRFARFRR